MRKQKENQVVYVLLSKSKRSFFMACGTEDTLRETYRHHIKKRRKHSLRFLSDCAPERPCLFILERINPEEDVNLLLVWLRILRENGYTCLNHSDMIEDSESLFINNKAAYNKRKDTDLSKLLSCEGCLVPKYNEITCPHYSTFEHHNNARPYIAKQQRKREKEIRIRVSTEEYERIAACAREQKMRLGPYIRKVAQSPIIRHYDYKVISDHTKEIAEIRNSINRLIFTIDASKNYLPREITTIVGIMQSIFEGENLLLKTIREQQEKAEENDRKWHAT